MEEYRKYEPIFGSWYLNRLIGKGSFGKVFEITREEFGTTYRAALKVITIPQDDDDVKSRISQSTDMQTVSEYYAGILKEIVNENEIMAQLKGNSNIVSYEDHQIIPHDDGIGYDILIRMELLTPLLDRLIERKLSEEEVVRLGIDMCKALELCHKKNIIHRDIKPQNIFISDNGDFKLGDFGIARTIEKTTGGMSKKGTYKYMAPEVFRGDHYNETVDLYSLGIVMYSLLNDNRGPFLPASPARVTHNDEEEARMRRFRGEPVPAPRYGGEMLSYIIQKACAFDPAARYMSAEQMRGDLESYYYNYLNPAAYGGRGFTGNFAVPPRQVPSPQPTPRPAPGPAPNPTPQPGPQPGPGPDKRRLLILGVAAIGIICIAAGLFALFSHDSTALNLTDIMSDPVFTGYDGYGVLGEEITVDETRKEACLNSIGDGDKRYIARAIADSVVYEADKTEDLSNGDTVTIYAHYDEAIAAEAGIEVSGTEMTVDISGLRDMPPELEGAVQYRGHFYKLVDDAMYWTDARRACESRGGHLVTIEDADEEDFIENLVEDKGSLYHYWLGATDEDSEGDWRWVTGEAVPMKEDNWGFEKWCGNQPNNITAYEDAGQDYMELQATKGDQGDEEYMTWTDIGDSGEAGERFFGAPDYNETKYYGYICEWDGTE